MVGHDRAIIGLTMNAMGRVSVKVEYPKSVDSINKDTQSNCREEVHLFYRLKDLSLRPLYDSE
jgi:hypothetical protein